MATRSRAKATIGSSLAVTGAPYAMPSVASRHMPFLGDIEVTRIGLGCMPLSLGRGRERGLATETIAAALDAGVNLLDTADAYALDEAEVGHNERLVRDGLRAYGGERAGPMVATKGGHTRHGTDWDLDGSPAHLRAACEASLRRSGSRRSTCTSSIALTRRCRTPSRSDALRDLRDEGKVRHVGLSNANVAQLEEAERIVPIAAIQNELSPRYIAPLAQRRGRRVRERGILFLAWSPLGGIGAATRRRRRPAGDPRDRRGTRRIAAARDAGLAAVAVGRRSSRSRREPAGDASATR